MEVYMCIFYHIKWFKLNKKKRIEKDILYRIHAWKDLEKNKFSDSSVQR